MSRRSSNPAVPALLPLLTISQQFVRLSAQRPVRAHPIATVGEVPAHDHDYYEICLVDGGSARHHCAAGERALAPGAVIVVPPGGVHAFTQCRGLAVTNLYYLAEWLLADARALIGQDGVLPLFLAAGLFGRRDPAAVAVWRLDRATAAACRRELREIAEEGARDAPSTVLLRAALVKFLVRLARSYAAAGDGALPPPLPADAAETLDLIEGLASAGEPLSVRALAATAGLTPDGFTRRFAARCGATPLAFFQRRRIHHACARLLQPGTSVTAIAHALGFADAAHLSRRFKEVMGMTPSEYRRRYGAG